MSSTEAIKMIEEDPTLMKSLAENTKTFRTLFTKNLTDLEMLGDFDSPIVHILLKKGFPQNREKEEIMLQDVVDVAYQNGVCVSRAKYCKTQEIILPRPSIRVCVTGGLSRKEIERCVAVLRDAFKKCVK